MLKALSRASGKDSKKLEQSWGETGDLGIVAEQQISTRSQQTLYTQQLTVEYVHQQLHKLATIEGTRSQDTKLKIISELLSHAEPLEAKYITRTILEELRIGIATSTVRDGIVYAFLSEQAGINEDEITDREQYNKTIQDVQSAYDKTNDFAEVAQAATQGIKHIQAVKIHIGTPIKVMLGYKGENPREAIASLGAPILLQYKYDGFRVEIHKQDDEIQIFTRRLENVTKQFPDIVESVRSSVTANEVILDAEAIAIDKETGEYKPFQDVSQRIRRKYNIEEIAEKLPVDVRVFDVLYVDGEEQLEQPLSKRHEQLQSIINEQPRFGVANTLITDDVNEAESFFAQARRAGTEGLFAKKIDSVYQPGTRVGNWQKLKETMEPLDVVVVGAERGEGKRSGWFTSYDIAIRDEENNLLEIGKVATGLKELEEEGFSFKEITELIKPLIEYEDKRHVTLKPQIVLEVGYEEIQKSPSYSSGYALRFPRILRNRTDEKDVEDISDIEYVQRLYNT